MLLPDWMKKERWTLKGLAKEVGCHLATMYLFKARKCRPSLKMGQKISEFTKGEVTIEDLMNVEDKRPRCPTCGRIEWAKKKPEGESNEPIH